VNPTLQNLSVLREVVQAFSALGIPHALGGSMASSLHGIPRYTQDADLVVEPFPGKEAQLAASFGRDYYVSLPAIQEAVRTHSSFNIINTSAGFKMAVFIRKDQPFEQSAMARRREVTLPDVPEQPIAVQTPEDVILFKLHWYRLGSETSSQQWSDVQGVLKVKAGQLNEAYLNHWAADLHVDDLLARARLESGCSERQSAKVRITSAAAAGTLPRIRPQNRRARTNRPSSAEA
jgi:hypothetical protein